jgi:hypothetical protein
VSLSAPLPGWQRLPVATMWLKEHATTQGRMDDLLNPRGAAAARTVPLGQPPRAQAGTNVPPRQPRDPFLQQMQ